MTQTCQICRHFHVPVFGAGECRRVPPAFGFNPLTGQIDRRWPTVLGVDSCSKWQKPEPPAREE